MNWDYIAGFFDGEGNIHVYRSKGSYSNGDIQFALMIRIYQKSEFILNEIKDFLGYGSIYKYKRTGVFELTFSKKEDVKHFLNAIQNKIILKKEQIDYVLKFYDFNKGNHNRLFDIKKFRSFVIREGVNTRVL